MSAAPFALEHPPGGVQDRARVAPAAVYTREEVVDILVALAGSEAVLVRAGDTEGAARVASLFDLVERRLVR